MRQDASVECGSDEHRSITNLAIFFIVVWPLGSLVLYSSLLAGCAKPLRATTQTALTRATGFLHREYTLTFYWWEALELARKLVLTGAVLLIPEERAFVRLVVATLICSCYVALVGATQPFKRVEDDALAVASSLVLLLFFLGANWTTIYLGIEERYPNAEAAAALFGFNNLNAVVDSMIVLVAIVFPIAIAGGIFAVRNVAKIPTIRLDSSRQKPELTLALGLTWHLFNSHIWSTGQARQARPCRTLAQRSIPHLTSPRTPPRSSKTSSSICCRASKSFSTWTTSRTLGRWRSTSAAHRRSSSSSPKAISAPIIAFGRCARRSIRRSRSFSSKRGT